MTAAFRQDGKGVTVWSYANDEFCRKGKGHDKVFMENDLVAIYGGHSIKNGDWPADFDIMEFAANSQYTTTTHIIQTPAAGNKSCYVCF